MHPDLAKLALELLKRVNITGAEVEVYLAVTNALQEFTVAPSVPMSEGENSNADG